VRILFQFAPLLGHSWFLLIDSSGGFSSLFCFACRNSVGSDRFSGCWATAGVLLDKGVQRVSAKGSSYSIWKMGALDETDVSLFLFGDAHVHYSGAAVGSVFAVFNGNVRMDNGVLLI
jgi:minichromosome maintenance protein 10